MKPRLLAGSNFSGRSARLRQWVGLPIDLSFEASDCRMAFVGPDAGASLSGIAPTVAAEIELMAADRISALRARSALADLGFDGLLPQNPFTLSGGEQVVVAVVAAAAGRPRRIAIDCAFEQLSPPTRVAVLAYLESLDCEVALTDNRWREWYVGETEHCAPTEIHQHAEAFDSDAEDPEVGVAGVDIELIDLAYGYLRNKPVLKGLNAHLKAGHRYLLKGPNGSGKTTLSKILCGLIKPQSGEIRVDGKAVKPWLTPGRYVGYHFQNPDFQLFGRTVAQQLADGSTSQERWARRLSIQMLLHEHPLDLPFTLRKRVAIAATLARGTPAFVLDEPTLCQDDHFVHVLRKHWGAATSVVVSHSALFSDCETIRLG